MRTDIIFYEVFKEEREAFSKYCPSNIEVVFTNKTIQEYNSSQLPAKLISIRTQSVIPPQWAHLLKGILTRSTGFDHVQNYLSRTRAKIACGYLPLYCSRAVAEQAILIMLSLLRKIKPQMKQFEVFTRDGLTGMEAKQRNLLVLGIGNIGSQIVDIARGLRMNVKGFDRTKNLGDLEYIISLPEAIQWADVLICALSLNASTQQMLSYDVLKTAKKGMVLVNIARGEITPIQDLARLLEEGILGGVGLDVFEEEFLLAESLGKESQVLRGKQKTLLNLANRDDVILTPHNAFNTQEAVERKVKQSLESMKMFLEEKKFPYPIPEGELC